MQDQTTRAPALSSRNSVPLPLLLAAFLTSASAPSTRAGASYCKCSGGADTRDELLRCLRCHRLLHTSCCPETERCDCLEACLLESRPREEQVPSWVMDLAAVDLSAPCRKDRFCSTCLVGFSGRRCPAAHRHAGGQRADAIEIHVLGEGDSLRAFVDVMQTYGLYDCSEIQLEMDLAPAPRLLRELVPLHPGKRGAKKYCGNIRIGDERLYCSMKCEVMCQAGEGAPSHPFVEALLTEDFTTGHQRDAFCTSCRVAFSTAVHNDLTTSLWKSSQMVAGSSRASRQRSSGSATSLLFRRMARATHCCPCGQCDRWGPVRCSIGYMCLYWCRPLETQMRS